MCEDRVPNEAGVHSTRGTSAKFSGQLQQSSLGLVIIHVYTFYIHIVWYICTNVKCGVINKEISGIDGQIDTISSKISVDNQSR